MRTMPSTNISAFVSDLNNIFVELQRVLLQKPNIDFPEVPEDLQMTKIVLQQVLVKYKDFLSYQKRHSTLSIQHVSFSKLKWAHLDSIGFTKSVHLHRDFLVQIDNLAGRLYLSENQSVIDTFDDYWRTDKHYITNTLAHDFQTFGRVSETGSRVTTDLIVWEVCFVLKTRLLHSPYVVLELVLASKKNGPVFIHDQTDTVALGLTGRVDYTLLSLLESIDPAQLENDHMLSDDLLKRVHLDEVLKSPRISKAKAEGHLSVCPLEVKNPVVNLEDFLAQVNGEALVLAKKMGRQRMPWCITNGVAWLFGMLQETTDGYKCFCLKEAIVLDDRFIDETNLKNILKILSVLATAPDEELDSLFPVHNM